jgi:hypothetical protein
MGVTGVRAPGTPWIGRWVSPTNGVDAVVKRKEKKRKEIPSFPYPESNPGRPVRSLVTKLTDM